MLSLYRAWLGPDPHVARPGPPPGALRPEPRRARPVSPASSTELDVERLEPAAAPPVLDVACCDGPVRFTRVPNAAYRGAGARAPQAYPCKTCGRKFPSYYFVHKHRKVCHGADSPERPASPQPSTSAADA